MALTLTFDYSQQILIEPGYWQFVSTRELADQGDASDDASNKAIWRDEPTKTLMLRPLQLDPSFLNTAAQVDSILGIGQMAVNAADLASTSIFQAAAFGNNDNPYIYHVPAGPSTFFPAAGAPAFPGSPPSLVGVPTPIDPTITNPIIRAPDSILLPSPSLVDPGSPPALTEIGNTADGKFLCHSADRLAANQALYFRWFHPESQLGYPCTYEFYVGQFKLRIKDVIVEVFRDTSDAGDRSAWKKVMIAPLFSVGDFSPNGPGALYAKATPAEILAHDRSLLWLPFRRNQVLLLASTGKWAPLTVRAPAVRLADDSDWDIVREDTLMVWVLTPAAGRFQVQRVKYPSGSIKVRAPILTLDYTPSVAPAITISKDSDHGTNLSGSRSNPPAYTLPENDASDCPPPTSAGGTDVRRQYGVELTFQASGDQRWTPFFYGFTAQTDRAFGASRGTPATASDDRLVKASLTAGLKPGEGRLTADVWDFTPFPLTPFYYRPSLPMQLKDGGVPLFTGIGEPTEVTPLKEASTPRRLTFTALDRWKALSQTFLRDQRDWTGAGHIDVVKFIVEQAGIDCTLAEFPAGYVPGTISTLNSRLGLAGEAAVNAQTGDVNQGWRPRVEDTAATYVQRIADLYSAWWLGFRLDGTFFYLPRTYFTVPTVTFNAEHSGGSPLLYGSPTFTTEEPEANVIVVQSGNAQTGALQYSSVWVDWASILNVNAVNYLGRWKAEVVNVGGSFSCAQINWIARRIWEQTRRRKITASWDAEFVPTLGIGHVCTLGPYGDYRVTGFTADLDHAGNHRAHYTGEFLENGF